MALGVNVFSIGQCIDEDPIECDFTRSHSGIEGAVALECDNHFDGWKIGITSASAIKQSQPSELFDGIIVY